jgi:glycogen(starch) synthase
VGTSSYFARAGLHVGTLPVFAISATTPRASEAPNSPNYPRPAARVHHFPLVLTVHTSLRHTLAVSDLRSAVLKALGGPIERWGEHSAEAVLVITPRLYRLLVSDGVEESRVPIIPPGVNPSLFEGPFEDPFLGVGKPRVLFVGRLAP